MKTRKQKSINLLDKSRLKTYNSMKANQSIFEVTNPLFRIVLQTSITSLSCLTLRSKSNLMDGMMKMN
jgi:hypothetical protein